MPASDCPRPPDQAIYRFHRPMHGQTPDREAAPGLPPHSIAPPRRFSIQAVVMTAAIAACMMVAQLPKDPKAPLPSHGAHHPPYRQQGRSIQPCRSRQAGEPIRHRRGSCQNPDQPSAARHASAPVAAAAPGVPTVTRHGPAVPPRPVSTLTESLQPSAALRWRQSPSMRRRSSATYLSSFSIPVSDASVNTLAPNRAGRRARSRNISRLSE